MTTVLLIACPAAYAAELPPDVEVLPAPHGDAPPAGSCEPDLIVLGPRVPKPTLLAQRVAREHPDAALLIVAAPETFADTTALIRITPFVPLETEVVADHGREVVQRLLLEAVERAASRRSSARLLAAAQQQLDAASAAPAGAGPDAPPPAPVRGPSPEDRERFFSAVVESSGDAILSTTLEGRITSWNRGASRLYEYTEEEAIGSPIDLIVPGDRRGEYEAMLARLAAGESTAQQDSVCRTKSGRLPDVSLTLSPIRDRAGRLIGVSFIGRDITSRLREARDLASRTLELQRVQEELRRMVADLRRSNDDLEQYAYAASHDLQEPLRMVTSYMELLERTYRGRLDEDADAFIRHAVDGARRMKRLIDGLLQFSRVGTVTAPFQPCPVDSIVDRVLSSLSVLVRENGATIDRGALPVVWGDPDQIELVVQNLLANAIKFRGAPPPVVTIRAGRDGELWRISVADNGIGFERESAEKIFQMFQRLHGRDEYPGSGIGLALARRIVDRHGGRIWAESTPGTGSCFHFTVPAAPGPQ